MLSAPWQAVCWSAENAASNCRVHSEPNSYSLNFQVSCSARAREGGRLMSGDTSTLRPHGGYRQLRSFQVTEIIYDGTVAFYDRFIDKRSRTHDQMVQAARSGRQNIAEGSRASATSSQTELRLVNVARASLDELLLDYEDFLRHRGSGVEQGDPEARGVRAVGVARDRTDDRIGLIRRPTGVPTALVGAPRPGSDRQRADLFDSPGQLSFGSSDPRAGTAVRRRRRLQRAACRRSLGEAASR